MRDEIKIIVRNLKETFDGKPWYGISMMDKLNAIPWNVVNENTYGTKSIAVLVQHIINWRIFAVKKLEGDIDFNIVIDGENDWDTVIIANQEEWNQLKAKLQDSQNQIIRILSEASDKLLLKTVPGKDYTFGPILASIAQHDIYHLGQIAMLNAMYSS